MSKKFRVEIKGNEFGEFIQRRKKQNGTVEDAFNNVERYVFQLNVLDVLNKDFKTTQAYGVKSGALDGPAIIGIDAFYYLSNDENDERVKYLCFYFHNGRLN